MLCYMYGHLRESYHFAHVVILPKTENCISIGNLLLKALSR